MRVEIVATFTAEPLSAPIQAWASQLGIEWDLRFAPYNQVVQELLDPTRETRQHYGVNVFLLRARDLAADRPNEALTELRRGFAEMASHSPAKHLVFCCPHPDATPPDAQIESEFVRELNTISSLHAFTTAELESHYPIKAPYDQAADRAGHVPYTSAMFCTLATMIARHIHVETRPPFKVIAVDADNTLWKGVVGEDGVSGIEVDPPYQFLQRFLLEKRSQGFLLAISSKNEASDVATALREHPDMLLKESDFAALKVNWRPKSENLRELSVELGIGLDSILFLDDNPAEAAEVAARCEGALPLTLPKDAEVIPNFLTQCWAFDTGKPTSEDAVRAERYQAQANRQAHRQHSASFHEFLESLSLEVQIVPAESKDFSRIAQLTSRTNQFNARKHVLTEAELADLLADGKEEGVTVSVKDKFGDYGLVGAMIYGSGKDRLNVSTFLLSCRALGKGVERRMIRHLGERALDSGHDFVTIPFLASDRNGICAAFLEEIGGRNEEGAYIIAATQAETLSPLPERELAANTKTGEPKTVARSYLDSNRRWLHPWQDPVKLAEYLEAMRQPRPALSEPPIAPSTETERHLIAIWEAILGLEGLGVTDTFTSLGGKSLQLVQMHSRLASEFDVDIPLTDLFELPTVRALSARLDGEESPAPSSKHTPHRQPNEPIAIIGMAVRTPGADSVETFWQNLKDGVSSLTSFSDEELASASVDPASVRSDPKYVPVKGCMNDIDKFDAAFFGILPKEAKLMDPQQRKFLELAWEALERAGYDPNAYDGKIGLWAGAYLDTYVIANLCTDKDFHANWIPSIQVGSLQAELGNDKDYLATRVSFKLNLRGPSMTVQTACSTSMVAICQAIQSLRAGESDMAMAGGITITLPEKKGYYYTEDGMLSKDGRVCTFSDEATGTVFGNGAGMVVLKRLTDAQRDGDHIHAVIRGAALNNDGGVKHSYTAPSVDGQVEVITMAQEDAGVDPDSITYIEAHGTGTPLGDPIEVAALTKCFRRQTKDRGYCTLGSLKPNVGHLDVASGVCGVIKTALSLEHAQIPPLLHFERPNPKIAFEESPFKVQTSLTDWETDRGPRRAAVSSFGVGGTNGHVVLEEPPVVPKTQASPRPAQLFLVSARTDGARDEAAQRLTDFAREGNGDLADAAYTYATGRKAFNKRLAIAAADWADLQQGLEANKALFGSPASASPRLCFMFPGQGAQHVGMAREFYECERVFRDHIDFCADYLKQAIGADLRNVIYPEEANGESTNRLKHTVNAQPAIFVIETGLARLYQSWGLTPRAMIGHSVGEFAAACIADVFSLEDGLSILATRGRLMGDLPGGAMLSVRLSEDAIQPYLDEADLAAVNGKELCVLAGSHEIIDRAEKRLNQDGVTVKHLHTSHGFHSRMMDPVIDPFAKHIAEAALREPSIPILSTVTQQWLTKDEACDPLYWAKHLRQPVQFYHSARKLAAEETDQVFIEIGPGQTLATLARQSIGREGGHVFLAACGHAADTGSDYTHTLTTLGKLWVQGLAIDWRAFYAHENRRRVVVPTYPFERKRHWFEAHDLHASPAPVSPAPVEKIESQSPRSTSPTEITESSSPMADPPKPARTVKLAATMREVLSELSDIPEEELDGDASFLELGFDSLLLTQVSKAFQDEFGTQVTMRQLIDELPSIDAMVAHLDATLDPSAFAEEKASSPPPAPISTPAPPVQEPAPSTPVPVPVAGVATASTAPPIPLPATAASDSSVLGSLISQQMQLMQQQLSLFQSGTLPIVAPNPAVPVPTSVAGTESPSCSPSPPKPTQPAPKAASAPSSAPAPAQAAHGPYKPLNRAKDEALTEQQQRFIADLTARYNAKTARSKERTQKYRHCFADPRTANGFNRLWKEMCYQIVVEKAQGSRLLDIDGNEYIDIVNGFGPGFLGHSPEFVTEALKEQLDKTIAVGPQAEYAGETAELVCKLIGADRVCFLNTGSEAVQAAMRSARTVTGRDKIIVFSKDYHGNFDEVLVRGANKKGKLKSLPIAPGIPRRAVEDVIVLDYGTDESLQTIRELAGEVAAVMVEPMQSRRPEFQPVEFIKEIRHITEQAGSLLIFDEVITGFRTGPGGAQEFYGVKADLATYGKVIGGGMPVGLVAGKREHMDTFDGGTWQYGDDSFPEAPVTFFAGTFVRHPLAIAAVHVMAKFFLEKPRSFWDEIYAKTARLAGSIDQFFVDEGIGIRMPSFSSQMFVRVSDQEKYGGLLFCQLREKGVFILEGLPCYLTASHSDEDVEYVINAFKDSVAAMRDGGFFGGPTGSGVGLGKLSGPQRQLETAIAAAPMTAAQQEIWLACHLDSQASCAYNEATTLHIQGAARFEFLEESLNEIIARHDALRATFSSDGKEIRFADRLTIEVPVHDLQGLTQAAQAKRLAEFKEAEATTPLDLENGPLIRAFAVQLGLEESILFITAHHIVCDGWSYNVLLEELSALYGAHIRSKQNALPSSAAFSKYATRRAKRGTSSHTLAFWQETFANPPEPISLPTDRPYPASRSFAGATERRTIPPEASKLLKRIGAKQKCTAYQTLLGTFEVLLAKLSGQSEFVIGTPAAGQTIEEDSSIIGHCVNFLPLRANVQQSASFNEHLIDVRNRVLRAFDHQDFTYGELLPTLKLPRSTGRMPLVEIEFNVERTDYHDEFEGLKTVFDPSPKRFVNFPIFINIIDSRDGLVIDCDYKTDLFDGETIQRWLGHFEQLIETLAKSPEQPLSQISLLDEGEENRLLHEWNATDRDYRSGDCLHEIISGEADKVAVSQGDTTLTYQELDEQANVIAAKLQDLGLAPDQLVGVFMDRQPSTVAALLGILKAGGAYVPLDPGFPKERIELMLEDAEPLAVLTTNALRERLPESSASIVEVTRERRSQNVISPATSSNLAYVIYTSGSTGKPKGVQIEHRAIVNFLRSMQETPGMAQEDILLAVTTLCFDISLLELFLPLISGARVEIASREQAINPERLSKLIESAGATHLQATPVTWRMLVETDWKAPQGFQMLCGGEAMPFDLAQRLTDSRGTLWNLYGPTETTVWSTVTRVDAHTESIHVGRPIANTSIYIVDEAMRLVPQGVPGRLFIGGHGLARGYANRPELTAEKFVRNPFTSKLSDRIYDTGDLARYRADGTIECLGRSDNQIKFNGYRIELGDIESAMREHPQIGNAAVRLLDEDGSQRLLGYVIPEGDLQIDDLRAYLKQKLPDYMVPGDFHVMESFPLTPNRKIDRRALPDHIAPEPVTASSPALGSDAADRITEIWKDLLGKSSVPRNANFFDVGGHSLLLLRLKNRLQDAFNEPVALAQLFKHTSIAAQANLFKKAVGSAPTVQIPSQTPKSLTNQDIAVIGMSGRFPGAPDLETFWSNLTQGVESIRDLTEDELRAAGVSEELLSNPNYIRRGGLIDHAEAFDHGLFGISPREAEFMDTQHRVFLEESYRAIEKAGYDPERYTGRIGVFAGSGAPQVPNQSSLLPSDYYAALTGSLPDYLTTRVAYRMNLRGPSVTVQTACSTSLVAVQVACQHLLTGECEIALAGGISLVSPQGQGYLYQDGMMLSPDGHCRAFAADAAGTVFTQGVGIVVLKPLEKALQEGDHIYAVIKAATINNDGADKIGFTAPSIDGQAELVGKALAQSGVDPETIGLMETHGTGTPLGDPIEIAALTQAYRNHTQAKGYCTLGALKSNIGHMDTAAGIGSMIKAILSLEHGEIPPMINYQAPNPKLDLEDSPFSVSTEGVKWERGSSPRRAAVSSFGIGGTNAHVILEEAPERASNERPAREFQILTFSARSPEALEATSNTTRQTLERMESESLADIAYTLNTGRKEYTYREMLIASSKSISESVRSEAVSRPVVFLFPGQGSAYHGMGKGLYETESIFKEAIDECDHHLESVLGWKLSDTLFAEEESDWSATDRAQPALFGIEYALANLWMSWGVKPEAMIGHSLGEYVAATLSGVFTLGDTMKIVAERGRLMQAMEPGSMLAIAADRETVEPLITGADVEIAVENSPRSTVVSGSIETIASLAERLKSSGLTAKRVATSHAFHSTMMEEAAESFKRILSSTDRKSPNIPYLSNLTGTWITPQDTASADYWCSHLRRSVQFSANVRRVMQDLGDVQFIEIGPGTTLSAFVRQHSGKPNIATTMRPAKAEISDAEALVQAIGQFWIHGGSFDWEAYHAPYARRRLPLPGYAFQRRHFEPKALASAPSTETSSPCLLHEVRWQRRVLSQDGKEKETATLTLSDLSEWREAISRYSSADHVRIVIDADCPNAASFEDYQTRVTDPLIALAQYLDEQATGQTEIVLLTPGTPELESVAMANPSAATLAGVALSLQQDLPKVRCRIIDRPAGTNPSVVEQAIQSSSYEPIMAIRGRSVYVPHYEPWQSDRSHDSPTPTKGAVIITGGFGAIGRACGEMIAKHDHLPVILVGRNVSDELPEGCQAYRADVSNEAEVVALLAHAVGTFGGIAGIIHAAGVVESVPLSDYSPEARRHIHAGKVQGALHFAKALRDHEPPAFVLLVSSVSSVLGGVGYTAYASGNAFLDTFAATQDGQSATRWLSLGLDAVATGDHVAPNELTTRQAAQLIRDHFNSAHSPTRLVVSVTPLTDRLQTWVYGMAETAGSSIDVAPAISSDRVSRLCQIWQEILKIDDVGAGDNFFELGGDSIIAIPMFQQIREVFGVSLPIATLFKAATPQQLAEELGPLPEPELRPSSVSPEITELAGANGHNGQPIAYNGHREGSPFSSNLLVKMKEGCSTEPPIFFTHPGGGSIVFYHRMVSAMSHTHAMYGIESPLLSQKRFDLTGMESIEAIAAGYTRLVQEAQPSGPYILAGYSFGGLVSLEMARLLISEGEEVKLLVFDTPNPQVDYHEHTLGERISHHWRREPTLGKKLAKVSKRATKGLMDRIQYSITRATARKLNHAETPSKSPRVLNFQILEFYDVLTDKFDPQPYPGDMDLFIAEDPGDKITYDPHLGWKEVVQGELAVTKVLGAHLTLFDDDFIHDFVRAVESCLEKNHGLMA